MPLVSIVTPSFNQVHYLEETIESVLNQDYPRIEYIIIDGGSTDGSADLIRKYENRLAYWVSERDEGQANAINKGFRKSKGEIVGWLNSDDTYTPGAIGRAVNALIENPQAVAVHGCANIIDQNGTVLVRGDVHHLRPFNLREQLCGNMLSQPTVLMRRQTLFEVGLLDPSLHFALDFDLWLKLALKGPIVGVDAVQANFRVSLNGKSMAQTQKFLPEVLIVLHRFFAQPDLPQDIRAMRRLAISHYLAHGAPHPIYRPRDRMSPEQIRRMRKLLWESVRSYPLKLRTVISLTEIFDSYLGTHVSDLVRRSWSRIMGERIIL
jgi:glycosyltransferase involved in cell wall biosynthesis